MVVIYDAKSTLMSVTGKGLFYKVQDVSEFPFKIPKPNIALNRLHKAQPPPTLKPTINYPRIKGNKSQARLTPSRRQTINGPCGQRDNLNVARNRLPIQINPTRQYAVPSIYNRQLYSHSLSLFPKRTIFEL